MKILTTWTDHNPELIMEREFRGKYINGKVELLQEVDIKEGEEVLVYIPLIRKRKRTNEVQPPAIASATENEDDSSA